MNPVNTIREYLKKEDMDQSSFAKKCKIARESVTAYLKGSNIHRRVAEKIERHTKGVIRYEQLTDKPRRKKRPRNKPSQLGESDGLRT